MGVSPTVTQEFPMPSTPVTLDRLGIAVPATRKPHPLAYLDTKPATSATATTTSTGAAAPVAQPFTSGFCGRGPTCRDAKALCRGTFENTHLIDIPPLHCTCTCHTTTAQVTTQVTTQVTAQEMTQAITQTTVATTI